MRIAYVMTHYPKHSQTFLFDEVRNVPGDGVSIVPIALNAPEPGDVESDDERVEAGRTYYVKSVPKATIARTVTGLTRRAPRAVADLFARARSAAGTDVKAALWNAFYAVEAMLVWDHCERTGCRHIHAQFGTNTATVASLAARLGTALTPDRPVTWSFTVHGYHEFTAEERYGIADKVRDADLVVGVSDYTRSQLMRLTEPEHWSKIHTVHCGIDLARFTYAPRPTPNEPPIVVTVGRLSPEKGQLVLLDAVRILRDRGIDVRARIVGGGPSAESLAARSAALGIADRVEFTGAIAPDQVAAELDAADVFCLASFAEGIPVSVMEALARGLPVVTTYVGGVAELVEDGVTGCIVPAGRPDRVADAIGRLVQDASLRARVSEQGRQRVVQEHDLTRTTATLRSLFGQLRR
jgi:colanic acid/amylovoran biosynthesis glycosyltransferase